MIFSKEVYEQYIDREKRNDNKVSETILEIKNPYTSKQPLGEEHSFIRIGTVRDKHDQTVLRIRK